MSVRPKVATSLRKTDHAIQMHCVLQGNALSQMLPKKVKEILDERQSLSLKSINFNRRVKLKCQFCEVNLSHIFQKPCKLHGNRSASLFARLPICHRRALRWPTSSQWSLPSCPWSLPSSQWSLLFSQWSLPGSQWSAPRKNWSVPRRSMPHKTMILLTKRVAVAPLDLKLGPNGSYGRAASFEL